MRVSSSELQGLIRDASSGAAPQERAAAAQAIAALRQARIAADLTSAGSRFLTSIVKTCGEIVLPAAIENLKAIPIYGVASAYANALAERKADGRRIFVFEGLLHQLFFVIDLLRVLERLQALRPCARFDLDGEDLPEALAFSLAGFAVLFDALAMQRYPSSIHDMLGPAAQRKTIEAYRLCVAFVLLHELGHLERGGASGRVRSERLHIDLIEPEQLSDVQHEELAADAYALEQIDPRYRAWLIPSLTFFFMPGAVMETFSGGLSASHPLAVNRLAALTRKAAMPHDEGTIITDWIEQRVADMRKIADRSSESVADLRARIERRLPVRRAYEVIFAIKERVIMEMGALETPRHRDPTDTKTR